MIQQTQKSFPGLLATGTFEKQPPARIRFLRFAYASCICSNFNWLLSLRKRLFERGRRLGGREKRRGIGARGLGTPAIITTFVHFCGRWRPQIPNWFPSLFPFVLFSSPPPFFAPATQATDSLVCLHHL